MTKTATRKKTYEYRPTETGHFPGCFVLENANGETVRLLNWKQVGASETIFVVYRKDLRRIETFSSLDELQTNEIPFDLIGKTSPEKVMAKPMSLGLVGQIRWSENEVRMSPSYELEDERELQPKAMWGWSLGVQASLLLVFFVAGLMSGAPEKQETEMTILPQEVVDKMLEKEVPPPAPEKQARVTPPPPPVRQNVKVEVSQTKITKAKVIPPKVTKRASVKASVNGGGGWKTAGKRGFGTGERSMNQIGALGALGSGNGGRGGLNLQAVSDSAGSGAGGSGRGGFGSNGAGGRGIGGLGKGRGMGLANAMYGKGVIAAPHGDGGAAPGSGGYGTRGKAGGGAQGAGYGSQTIVGSWKGTGPKGEGPGGAGWGKGGAGWGAGLDDGDAVGATVSGGLDMDAVQAVIDRHMGEITYCYEKGLQVAPSLKGRVAIRFEIGPNGRVNWAKVNRTTLRSAQVESCISSRLKTWPFPKPHGGVTVGVTYPFTLNRTMAAR